MRHTRGDEHNNTRSIGGCGPLLLQLLLVAPLLPSCATIEAAQAYPEATWALLEAFVSDILSVFTFFL